MKYMLLIYGNHQAWDAMSSEGFGRLMTAHTVLQEELTASGELVDTNELSVEQARTVRTTDGTLVVTDGPFSESKEIFAGYYLIDCRDLDRATEIAGRLVESEFAPIEVRRVGGD